MKKYLPYWIALGIVTAWCAFSYAYLGLEDGSSGLSILGRVHAVFFIPGGMLFQVIKGSHSNSDLPLVAAMSWAAYALLALLIAKGVSVVQKKRAQPSQAKG